MARHEPVELNSPSPDRLRALAKRHGLTGSQAAALVHVTPRAWRYLIAGERVMSAGLYELLLVKLGEHPRFRPRRGGKAPRPRDAGSGPP